MMSGREEKSSTGVPPVDTRTRENTGETPVLREMPVGARSREASSTGVSPVDASTRENTGETPVLLPS